VVPQVRALRETVYGVKTHYVHAGEGEPLVLVHGAGPGASGESGWANAIPVLARRFHVYAPDQIGYGLTDKPLVEYSLQTVVDHVAGFIEALNLPRVRLVGNSQGAYVAMKYALDYPTRVEQVAVIGSSILANAVGIPDPPGRPPFPRFDGSKDSLRAFLQLIVNDWSKVTDELLDERMAAAVLPGAQEMRQSIVRYRRLLDEDPSEAQVYDVTARLARFRVPWCIIWGADDRTAPLDPMGYALRDMFPEVPFHVVAGSGHQVQNDQPEECNRLLSEFFGVPAGAAVGA
jgi:pimeloyl-ACP methyl ester carboxylesterase